MIIKELDYKKYKGQKYQAEILSDRFLSIEPVGEGFAIKWVMSEEPLKRTLNEDLLSDWLEDPLAYGAFEGDKLIGMVEGFLEKWNNRFRMANICVFDQANRRSGVGQSLWRLFWRQLKKVVPGWWCSKRRPLTLRQFHFIKNTDLRLSALTGMPTPTAGQKNITCA